MIEIDGLWALMPEKLEAIVRLAKEAPWSSVDLAQVEAAKARHNGRRRSLLTKRAGGAGVIAIPGVIMRSRSFWLSFFGISNVGLDDLKRDLAEALADDDISEIVLQINSPGGTTEGLAAFASEVAAAAEQKRITAYVDGTAASAAYWIASQTAEIVALQDSIVGSIGVYSVIRDASALAEDVGIKVHVLRSGPNKGIVFGAPVKDGQLAMQQAVVDDIAAGFTEAVAKGRELSADKAEAVSDGSHWTAGQGLELGLVDRIGSISEMLSAIAAKGATTKGRFAMSEQQNHKPATIAELEARFDDSGFILGQLKANATLEEASVAWTQYELQAVKAENEELQATAEALRDELAENKATIAELQAKIDELEDRQSDNRGERLVRQAPASSGIGDDFIARAKEIQKEEGCKLSEAMSKLRAQDPESHSAWLKRQMARS